MINKMDSGVSGIQTYGVGSAWSLANNAGQLRIRLSAERPTWDVYHAFGVIRNGFSVFPEKQPDGSFKFSVKQYNEGRYSTWLEAYEFMMAKGVPFVLDGKAEELLGRRG